MSVILEHVKPSNARTFLFVQISKEDEWVYNAHTILLICLETSTHNAQ